MSTPQILLPITDESFESLIDQLMAFYPLPNREHASAVVAQRIMHLPPTQATCTLEYLADCVWKNAAYQLAENRSKKANQKMQIDQIDAFLKNDPNNQQALDALAKAADEGSDYAKEILAKYRDPIPPNVVSIHSLGPSESKE